MSSFTLAEEWNCDVAKYCKILNQAEFATSYQNPAFLFALKH